MGFPIFQQPRSVWAAIGQGAEEGMTASINQRIQDYQEEKAEKRHLAQKLDMGTKLAESLGRKDLSMLFAVSPEAGLKYMMESSPIDFNEEDRPEPDNDSPKINKDVPPTLKNNLTNKVKTTSSDTEALLTEKNAQKEALSVTPTTEKLSAIELQKQADEQTNRKIESLENQLAAKKKKYGKSRHAEIDKHFDRLIENEEKKSKRQRETLAPQIAEEQEKIKQANSATMKAQEEMTRRAEASRVSSYSLDELDKLVNENKDILGILPGYGGIGPKIGGKHLIGGVIGAGINAVVQRAGQTTKGFLPGGEIKKDRGWNVLSERERFVRSKLQSLSGSMAGSFREIEVGGKASISEYKNIMERNVIGKEENIESMLGKLASSRTILSAIKDEEQIWNSMRMSDGTLPTGAESKIESLLAEKRKAVAKKAEALQSGEIKPEEPSTIKMIDENGDDWDIPKEQVQAVINSGKARLK